MFESANRDRVRVALVYEPASFTYTSSPHNPNIRPHVSFLNLIAGFTALRIFYPMPNAKNESDYRPLNIVR